MHDGEHPSAPYRCPLASDLFHLLPRWLPRRVEVNSVFPHPVFQHLERLVLRPRDLGCLSPMLCERLSRTTANRFVRPASSRFACETPIGARACVRIPSEQSDDDRSSCSSGKFAEITAGASGALRVQDLERGASSDFEGIVSNREPRFWILTPRSGAGRTCGRRPARQYRCRSEGRNWRQRRRHL